MWPCHHIQTNMASHPRLHIILWQNWFILWGVTTVVAGWPHLFTSPQMELRWSLCELPSSHTPPPWTHEDGRPCRRGPGRDWSEHMQFAAGPVLCGPATPSAPHSEEHSLEGWCKDPLFYLSRRVISFRDLRERVRAALSSSGSLLFRLSSSVLSIRRSRADGLGLRGPTPWIPQLLQALHSRREFLPTAKEKNKSGSWPTENLNDAIELVL